MRINKYGVLLDADRVPCLVKESGHNYADGALSTPYAITNMLNTVFDLSNRAEEHTYMIAFNIRLHVCGVFEVSHGTVDCSILNPREVYIRALLAGATQIVIAHNHPSGDVTMSDADWQTTKRLSDVGHLLNVRLLDFLTASADGAIMSAREERAYIFDALEKKGGLSND